MQSEIRNPKSAIRRPAFSLVELLIVLAIIALLVSLLLPSLKNAREQARRVQCAAQLRSLHQAFVMYANANQGWLPPWSGWHTYPDAANADDQPGPSWTERLTPYFSKPDSAAYNCPSWTLLTGTPRMNYFLAARWTASQKQSAMKLSDVTMTSRFVLSGDMTLANLYPPPFGRSEHALDDCDKDDAVLPSLAFPGTAGAFWMHHRANNVLFDDGHVAPFAAFDPAAMTHDARRMADWEAVQSPN